MEKSQFVPEAIHCLKGNLAHSKAFQKGILTIQDESSMIVALALGVEENEMYLMHVQLLVENPLILPKS